MSISDRTSLGDRMKEYESVTKSHVMRRTPVIIRLDGKAFHTYTRKVNETNDVSLKNGPFSEILHEAMNETMKALGSHIQNVKFGYTQSDEISLLLTDWNTLKTDQWFGGNIQKMVSVSAAIATAHFNMFMMNHSSLKFENTANNLAFFDSRVYNLPVDEVVNYFIWRQQDTTRNSINMLGQFYFSHNQLHGKNVNEVQDMLIHEYGINWNDLSTWMKRGSCYHTKIPSGPISDQIPIFTQDRNYIEQCFLALT